MIAPLRPVLQSEGCICNTYGLYWLGREGVSNMGREVVNVGKEHQHDEHQQRHRRSVPLLQEVRH